MTAQRSTPTGTQSVERAEPITVGVGTCVDVDASHGPDWFPLFVHSGMHRTTLYLRRAQLHALRCRLDEIDDTLPQPEATS